MINLVEKRNNIRNINSKLLDLEEKFIKIDNDEKDIKNKLNKNKEMNEI
jgi:hypothetical protein